MADYGTPVGMVRLLVNDTSDDPAMSDVEVAAFLSLENQVIKLAAAQILDVIASNEAMTSKVIRSQDLSTDGAKVADALRKQAASLRLQAAADLDNAEGFFFDIFDPFGCVVPELAEYPVGPIDGGAPASPGYLLIDGGTP